MHDVQNEQGPAKAMGEIDGMQERGLGVGGKSTGTRIGRSSCFSVMASPEHPMGG